MQLTEIYCRYGWGALGKSVAYKLLQRAIVLDISQLTVLDVSELSVADDTPFEFRPLEGFEIRAFGKDPTFGLSEAAANRVSSGLDYCFAALRDGQLVGYTWLALNSIEAAHNRGPHEASGVALSYPPTMMFMYKAFVHPDARGNGLYQELVFAGGRWAHQELGIRFQVSTADWTNFPALRSCQRQGCKVLGLVYRFGLPGHMRTLAPREAKRLGITVGDDAQVTQRCGSDVVSEHSRAAVLQSV